MTGAKKGRPRGAGYDKHFDAVADLILASKGTKDLSTAMQELFPLDFKFPVSRPAALKRIRTLWKEDSDKFLEAASKRAQKRDLDAAKTKIDLALIKAAHDLLTLTKDEIPLVARNSDIGITMFMPRATPEDYKANPMVPRIMSFGQFQIAYERRYIAEKRREQRERRS